jgi:phospholipid/cholesterol/gamma-HCH transport system substrate-binding protein
VETRAGYVVVGAFVLALFVAAIGGAILLGDIRLDQDTRPFRIDFNGSVAGLSEGSAVRYRGVPVGSVTRIAIDPDNVEQIDVLVEIDSEVPIKSDMVAVLESQGLTGIGYIEIQGGTRGSADLEEGLDGELPRIPSRPSGLQQVFQTAPEIASQLVVLMARAERFLKPENEQALASILENMDVLAKALGGKTEEIEGAIDAGTGAAREIETATRELTPVLQSLEREITDVSAETKSTLATVRGAASGLDEEITALSRSLKETSDRLGVAAGTGGAVLDEMRPGLRDFSETGLYEISQFLVEARVMVSNLDQLVRQINRDPSQFLFGNQEGQVEAK